jgi:hypothetical protein
MGNKLKAISSCWNWKNEHKLSPKLNHDSQQSTTGAQGNQKISQKILNHKVMEIKQKQRQTFCICTVHQPRQSIDEQGIGINIGMNEKAFYYKSYIV